MATINKNAAKSFYALALARIGLGFIFLWAFLDKMFGLGFSTCRDASSNVVNAGCSQSWVNGGSPTNGFLGHATQGPLASWYQNLAGQTWVDWLFMAGLLGIGVGLILGIGMRLSTVAGSVLLLLMWSSLLWPANNPLIDEHLIYVCVLIALNLANSQQKWGLRSWWTNTHLVKTSPFLE
jgi:thiosulfate dehydrogenase [quinone] large subunit